MTRLKKLERDFLQGNIAAVTNLLAQIPHDDVMARFGLEERLVELRAELDAVEVEPEVGIGPVALFFGGKPVVGSRGIESEFGGTMVTKFQDLVAKMLAHDAGGLRQRGVVPNKSASTLHITNVARGSFGFVLEAIPQQPQILGEPLDAAISETTRLLTAFGEPDEEEFRTAVEEIDDRVLSTAREFFDLMRSNEATLRLVAGAQDRAFGHDAVERAADRATNTSLEEEELVLDGRLAGFLPDAHQFEFDVPDGRPVRGRVTRDLPKAELLRLNREWTNLDARVRVLVRRVKRRGDVVRENYELKEFLPPV